MTTRRARGYLFAFPGLLTMSKLAWSVPPLGTSNSFLLSAFHSGGIGSTSRFSGVSSGGPAFRVLADHVVAAGHDADEVLADHRPARSRCRP